jgi:hypothetical protein
MRESNERGQADLRRVNMRVSMADQQAERVCSLWSSRKGPTCS